MLRDGDIQESQVTIEAMENPFKWRHYEGEIILLCVRAIAELQAEDRLKASCEYRACKYLNNRVEQDHRFIKRRVNPDLGFGSFPTAWRTTDCIGNNVIQSEDASNYGVF